MGYGKGEQLEAYLWKQVLWDSEKPWKMQKTTWRKLHKKFKNRRERRRVKQDLECAPEYKKFRGWEY